MKSLRSISCIYDYWPFDPAEIALLDHSMHTCIYIHPCFLFSQLWIRWWTGGAIIATNSTLDINQASLKIMEQMNFVLTELSMLEECWYLYLQYNYNRGK